MGNACSSGSGDRKGSDAYNPGRNFKNEMTGKSGKDSWRKGSKSKSKNEKFSEIPDVPSQDKELNDANGSNVKNVELEVVQITHTKLESKVSEDISSSSIPIGQSEAIEKDDSFFGRCTETVKNLLSGKVDPDQLAVKSKKILLYIVSDDNDSIVEHMLIRDEIYPHLKKLGARSGYEICLVDLHNSLKYEYLDDHSFLDTCIGEIEQKGKFYHVVPFVFMKGSLISKMVPVNVSEVDFVNLLNRVDECTKSLLTTWYYLEKNFETPQYQLRHITNCLPNFSSSQTEERNEALVQFKGVIGKLNDIMWKYSNAEFKQTYFKTGLQLEIETIIKDSELLKNCVAYSNFGTSSSSDSASEPTYEANSSQKNESLYNNLKNKLESSRVFKSNARKENGSKHPQYKDDFRKQSLEILNSVIESIIHDDKSEFSKYSGLNQSLVTELILQSRMCQEYSSSSDSPKQGMQSIKEYVEGDDNRPLIVHGECGSGKSTLLCNVAKMCSKWLPNAIVVFRILGVSLESSTEERIALSICQQCANMCLPDEQFLAPVSFIHRSSMLPELFSKICIARPLVVIIDGLDQISSFSSSSFSWLPHELSPNVKVILSVSDESPQLSKLKEIIQSDESYLAMPKTPPDDSMNIFQKSLRLIDEHVEIVKKTFENDSSPLFAHLLAHSAKTWSSETAADDLGICETFENQVMNELNIVERKLGKIRVCFALGFITAGKHGLSDSEIQDILYINEMKISEEMKDFDILHEVSPVMLWTQLKRNLKPLLTTFDFHGIQVNKWKSRRIDEIVRRRYLVDEHQNTTHIRKVLLQYFDIDTPPEGKTYHQYLKERACSELPYQAIHVDDTALGRYIFELKWLIEKLSSCDTYQLLEDVILGLNRESNKIVIELGLMKEFLEFSHEALSYNGRQFVSQFYGRFHTLLRSPEKAGKCPLLSSLFDSVTSFSSFTTLLPLNRALKGVGEMKQNGHSEQCINYSSLYRITNYPRHMVSISPSEGLIIVWDISTMTAVRTLKGVTNPRGMQMIDEHYAIVLCNRELKIYNLDEGTLKTNIKGVMNQNMPYFGLHNHEHVVALSRNRMYVNMMNTETGDLVTTFKVGEDRFLNSLIVSKNGKICVCGDQTQKPSPLLVWDLTSRKLMYDLRIPHHEFLTKYAAITNDGNYVVCVSKEVESSTLSNVVVYDLQSGTMFKKWKPTANISCIAISSNGNCVITGLQDNSLAVWDLVTGANRATLVGHTSPATHISLCENGTIFVTYDSTNQDKTIRLWDSSSTEVVAAFTPDYPIICCEISTRGDSIVMGLEGVDKIVTLLVCQESKQLVNVLSLDTDKSYGQEDNHGKIIEI